MATADGYGSKLMEYDPETCTTAVNVELNCLRAEISDCGPTWGRSKAGIREPELEMAAEQRRLCAPEVARMDVRAPAALKKSVDERAASPDGEDVGA